MKKVDAKLISAEFGVTRMTVYRWINKGKFTYKKLINPSYLVAKDEKYYKFLEQYKSISIKRRKK